MTMTPDQVQANELLSSAVDHVLSVYDEPDDQPQVLTEYIVIASRQSVDDDGDLCSTFEIVLGGTASTPAHALGLVEYARVRLRGIAEVD